MNVLYFEGAGWDYEVNEESDVCNYRIRTVFTNNEGEQIYIELGRANRPTGKNRKKDFEWALRIDHLFNLADRANDGYEMDKDYKEIRELNYTKADIVNWINKNLNCNFDTIQVLDMFYGYRVFADNGLYNLIEDTEINHERAAKRRAAYNQVDMEYRRLLNEKYSKICLLGMDQESIDIKCYASDQALGDIPRYKKIEIA